MIKLQDDRLTFTFPEIVVQLTALLEQHIQQLLPTLRLPKDRNELVDGLKNQVSSDGDDYWEYRFRRDDPPWDEGEVAVRNFFKSRVPLDRRLRCTAESLTEADVINALRERVSAISFMRDGYPPSVTFDFKRTTRIPEDGRTYPLPAGLGLFPLRAVDDFPETTPALWLKRGGVLMPMYQSEALWIGFSASYPFAVKVAAGKINAVSGAAWSSDLQREPQDYLVLPDQPWLDGFAVGEGFIRQFVAMPLGAGYSVEEQLTGQAEFGGMQFEAHPMSAETYFREQVAPMLPSSLDELLLQLFAAHLVRNVPCRMPEMYCAAGSMGLAAGGKMRQEIYRDPHPAAVWDETQSRRCFIHLCNSLVWRQITGTNPPHPPLTAREYQRAGIPWFDYYRDDQKPLQGSERLASVKSVAQLGMEKNDQPLPENEPATPERIVQYGNSPRPDSFEEFIDSLETKSDLAHVLTRDSIQVRSPCGNAFWSFPADAFEGSTIEDDIHTKVHWNGRQWMHKEKERTLNEIVAYQIAVAIGLPLQPWLAFIQPGKQPSGAGMLIEFWTPYTLCSPLDCLDSEHAELMALGLSLTALNGDEGELPSWLMSEDRAKFRLFDLEGVGPSWPLGRPQILNYLQAARRVFTRARTRAESAGVTKKFDAGILRLTALDLDQIIDLSGQPNESDFTETFLSSLHSRQRALSGLLSVA